MKAVKIFIAVLAVFAIVLALVIFLPSSGGELTAELTGTDFNGPGDAIRVRSTITNETNKPAFKVSYEIIITKEDGTVLETYTKHVGIMMPGAKKNTEDFIYFDEEIQTGDIEINVNGYILGE